MADESFVSDDTEPVADDVTHPGSRLRRQREKKGLEIATLARDLNVDPWMLEALERDEYEALGAPVFVKGHLRKYACTLGVDADELMVDYYRTSGSRQAPPLLGSSLLRAEAASRRRRRTAQPVVLLVLAVAALGGLAWWYMLPTEPPASVALESDSLPAESTGPSLTTPAFAGTADGGEVTLSLPPPSSNAAASGQQPTASAQTQPNEPAVAAPVESAPVTARAPRQAVAATDELEVSLKFAADSWVEVFDSRDTRLLYGMGNAGTTKLLRGAAPVRVFLGRAGGVEVAVNGEAYPMPRSSRRGNTARFVIE